MRKVWRWGLRLVTAGQPGVCMHVRESGTVGRRRYNRVSSMSLGPGDRIGGYEIVAPLGEGGMGQVWRARDLRLPREVAIKLLPGRVASDPERLARFTREAEVLATMSHPHISTLHGIEEGDFGRAIVMELVQGDGLDARLAGGPLPMREALTVARDVADALESAHEQGIVHRDLKPANLKLAADGRVKVLDFGLARAAEAGAAGAGNSQTAMYATQAGVLLGTASYMSPEQARGEVVDRRADIWAFGCVLYEILTGRRAFDGHSAADVIGAVIRSDPDLTALPAATPPRVRWLIEHCLRKDARSRLRDVGDARVVLEDALAGTDTTQTSVPPSARGTRGLHVAWSAAALALAAATGLLGYRLAGRDTSPALRKLEILVADPIVNSSTRPLLSPDGGGIVYAAADRLWVRRFDQADPREVPGSSLGERPFWSPDGSELAFAARGQLWRVGVDAGAPVPVCDLPGTGRIIAGAWRHDGTILFSSWYGSIHRVPASGGDPVVFHEDPAVIDFHEIALLPDGETLLVVPHRAAGNLTEIAALRGGVRRTVLSAPPRAQVDMPRYSPTGHLVFVRREVAEGVWAVPFDVQAVATRGEPFRLVAGEWAADVSRGQVLAYTYPGVPHELAWLDRTGKRLGAFAGPRWALASPALSPDGRRAAAPVSEVAAFSRNLLQMWTFDLGTGRADRLPVPPEPVNEDTPEWSPDGARLVSVNSRQQPPLLVWRVVADGSLPRPLAPGTGRPSWAPDGRTIAFARSGSAGGTDIWTVDLPPDGRPGPSAVLIDGAGNQRAPRFSPDGRFLAYESDESGRPEVYVRRFPVTPERWVVSRNGGSTPRWSRIGPELFYRARDGRVMAVAVSLGLSFKAAEPQPLFHEASLPGSMSREFDVAPDGQRFLVVARAPGNTSRIVVVQNWLREFEQ